MSEYTYRFNNNINKNTAFTDYMRTEYSNIFISHNSISPTEIDITFNKELTQEEILEITNYVTNYVEPSYYLVLHHTDTQIMNTEYTNSQNYKILQSFIMPPDILSNEWSKGDHNTYLGSMKTILEIKTNDVTFVNTWNSETEPIILNLKLHCLSYNVDIVTENIDITDQIQNWKNASPSLEGEQHIWKTHQIYGLYNVLPDHDCIWQISVKVNNENINVRLNGLQKLYYTLD